MGAVVLVLLGLAVVGVMILGAVDLGQKGKSALTSSSASPARCDPPRNPGSRARGRIPEGKIVLTPVSKEITWAFDGDRNRIALPVVITASPRLTGVNPAAIQVETQSLLRTDNHRLFPNGVAFSQPRISRNGERITFEVCLDAEHATAGKYVGTVFVSGGPVNVAGTTFDLVVTTRSPTWFGLGLVLMFGAIVVVLTLKGVSDYQRSIDGTTKSFEWRAAFTYIWQWDGGRLVSSIVGLGTALIVGLRVYNTDRVWGDDAYQDSVALIVAAITAVGAQGVFDGFIGTAKGGR